MQIVAASVYVFLTIVVIGFQIALAAGAPWGHLAMGGKFPGRFPTKLRLAALVQAGLLGALALIVLAHANIASATWKHEWAIWLVVTINAASAVMNLATPSKQERLLWGPVAVVLLACSVAIATA